MGTPHNVKVKSQECSPTPRTNAVWKRAVTFDEMTEHARQLERENNELTEALNALTELCDNVPVFQLDDGKASVKAVRLAGKFTNAHRNAQAILAKARS